MRQAASDLKTTSNSVDVIAHSAGYQSRSSFVRAFKRAYGQDPTEYRATDGRPRELHVEF
jgi:AraC family transcriptional activator of mtrCDE